MTTISPHYNQILYFCNLFIAKPQEFLEDIRLKLTQLICMHVLYSGCGQGQSHPKHVKHLFFFLENVGQGN